MPKLNYPEGEYIYLNGWMWYTERTDIRDEGWKLHVSGDENNAQKILDLLLPMLREGRVAHKFLETTEEIASQTGGQRGKWLAVYPDSIIPAFVIVSEIDRVLTNVVDHRDSPIIEHEKRVGDTVVYTRYGAYNSALYDPVNDTYVDDTIGSLKPEWIQDPWALYSNDPEWRMLSMVPPWPDHGKEGWRKNGRKG